MAAGPRLWRVRSAPAHAGASCRVNLRVIMGEAVHVDTVDLMQSRARNSFLTAASAELRVKVAVLKSELGRVLRGVEAWQDEQRQAAARASLERANTDPALSAEDHEAALNFLKSPDLIPRILGDLDAMGLVGETANKLAVYLAASSRLLRRPLGILVQSSSPQANQPWLIGCLISCPNSERIATPRFQKMRWFTNSATFATTFLPLRNSKARKMPFMP